MEVDRGRCAGSPDQCSRHGCGRHEVHDRTPIRLWLSEGWALYDQGRHAAEFYPGEMSAAERIAQNRELDGACHKQYGPPGKPNAAEHEFTALLDAWLDSPTTPPETGPLAG